MKMNKIFNILILILLLFMICFRMFNSDYFDKYNNLLSYLGIFVVLVSSIYFTLKLRFLQFNIYKMYKVVRNSSSKNLMALFMNLGSKIGVGSILGVSIAISSSGPGVIFWIWIISLLSSILTYVETYLGVMYKNNNGGGVFYYISKGLSNKGLAVIYTIILIFVYVVGFVGVQANTIVRFTSSVVNIDKYILILMVCYVIIIIIFNNISSVISFMGKIVPVMCLLYLGLSLSIIISNIDRINDILLIIIKDGFKCDRMLLGTIIVGLQRGLFATESGIGTSSIASIIGDEKGKVQGLFQVMGVHFIWIFIITITGIIIISSNSYLYVNEVNNLSSVFGSYYGIIGEILLCIIIFLFAISTIVSGYYYSVVGLGFLKKDLDDFDHLFMKILVILIVFLGGIVKSSVIWDIIDDLILFLLFINIYAMLFLRDKIK